MFTVFPSLLQGKTGTNPAQFLSQLHIVSILKDL
jgi:hypothetical protein